MAAEREVIREFLVALGFQVDTVGVRKFFDTLLQSAKSASKVSAAIIGVAVSAEAMVQVFSRGMEKMYYAGQRTRASVANIQALDYAFRQIGLSGDDAIGTLESFSHGLRTQPGLMALLKSLGVKTQSGDRVEMLYDLIGQLSKLPHEIGAQWAEQFGIPEHVFLHMKNNLTTLIEAHRKRREMTRNSKVDDEAAAKAAMQYMNALRELWERVELLGKGLALKLLPLFKEFNNVVNLVLEDFSEWSASITETDLKDLLKDLKELMGSLRELGVALKSLWSEHGERIKAMFWVIKVGALNSAKAVIGLVDAILLMTSGQWQKAWERLKQAGTDLLAKPVSNEERAVEAELAKMRVSPPTQGGAEGAPRSRGVHSDTSVSPRASNVVDLNSARAASLFAGLEKMYGLPTGLLDAMWAKESARGTRMLSPAGAEGHFQFMPATARQYGLKNPYDLTESAGSAARMMADLLRQYGGNLPMALAGYNWGSGNLQQYGLGRAPAETRDYIDTITRNVVLKQETKISINGGDARSTATEVARSQDRVNGDLVRNLVGAVR